MRIGIIGSGFVASTIHGVHNTSLVLTHSTAEVKPEIDFSVDQLAEYCGWIYVCDTGESVATAAGLDKIFDQLKHYEGYVISTVTMLPSYYKELERVKNKKYKFKLIYMPYFIRQQHSREDYMNRPLILLGGSAHELNWAMLHIVTADFTHKKQAKIIKTDMATAAAVKYYHNSFLSTKITFNNQFANWIKNQQADWNEVKEVLKLDPALGNSHYDVPGWDKKFGYDSQPINSVITNMIDSDLGSDLSLIKYQQTINEVLRSIDTEPKIEESQLRPRNRARVGQVAPTRVRNKR
jgi:UDP-glucose 6-dehydrogenase